MKNSSKTPTFVDQNKIYHMKRTLLLIFTLLTVTLAAVAQPRISSNKETHNFGQIEWKKPVTVEYTITNTGNEPLVLTNVTTSCAWAVADWTKEPIAPGAKGTVKASFDAKALGRFDKSIGIYSNATPNLVYLKFTGEVVQEIKDYSKLLPYAIGNIRIDRDEFSFPDVYRGQQPSMTFSIANLSDRPYCDKVSEDNEIPVSAILLPDFSRMTEKDSLNAPSIHISETNIDLSIPLIKKNKVSHDILIANAGKTSLVISKLQVFNSSVGVRLKKTVIPPDGMTKLKVTIHKRDVGNKKHHLRILMITNDPLRPKVEINIKR